MNFTRNLASRSGFSVPGSIRRSIPAIAELSRAYRDLAMSYRWMSSNILSEMDPRYHVSKRPLVRDTTPSPWILTEIDPRFHVSKRPVNRDPSWYTNMFRASAFELNIFRASKEEMDRFRPAEWEFHMFRPGAAESSRI